MFVTHVPVFSCTWYCFNSSSLVTDEEITLQQVTPMFAEKVSGLRRVLAEELLVEPHHVGGHPVFGGVVLSSLVTEAVNVANQGMEALQPSR